MISAPRVCPRCGARIFADAPRGFCSVCLFKTGLGGFVEEDGETPPVRIPMHFGDFEIAHRDDGSLWKLGHGAMGVTYLAVDNVLRRKVALKVIDVPVAARTSQPVRERFLREARAAAALRHPNVAAVFQFGASTDGGHCYYAMELVEGETLEARVRRDGPLNAKLALEIAIQISRALMAAAASGLIHRDLKPSNIMLTRGDADTAELEVKVIDFGLAKAIADAGGEMDLTHGGFVGTPNFASPEQFESGPVDVRSDIYSLGVTLWFALTGKTPFAGRNIEEIRSAQKSNVLPIEQLKAARVPSRLRSLLESMLAFEPAARPGIQDLAVQLRRCCALAEIDMAGEVKKEIQLEIAHVLFIDIVGYSKLSINEQHAAVDQLTQIVRATEQFQKGEASERLIKIATGDGMTLVFYTSPEAPVRCAVELSHALKDHPHLHVRMGIHSGPVRGVVDVTGRTNLAGAGLNLARRVMDCGDAGHILLSKHVAEDLSEFEEWRSSLHDLGTCEIKHGMQVTIVNFWSDDVGNRQLPKKFQALRKQRARVRWAEVAAALLLLAGIAAAFVLVSKKFARSISIVPEKSIAVLPFENLSEEKANAFFADGVQDEILTDLARIADLKVISRGSVMHYKSGIARNLREIGRQLEVANVVEGSVQRSGNRVRVNAQLIDTRTDAHLWAQTYDRDLADVFAIQSEIAKTIADQLQAKLSPSERQAIERAPTSNLAAFDLYARAKDLLRIANPGKAERLQAIDLLDQAVARDPSFFDAYCQLANAHGSLYSGDFDRTPARFALAAAAAEAAGRLRPDAGETHLARARNLYYGPRDYQSALAELEVAGRTLPNDPQVAELKGYIERRQGRWDESTRDLERAIELDPRNAAILGQVAISYHNLRRYAELRSAYNRILSFTPNDAYAQAQQAYVDFEEKADSRPYHEVVDSIRRTNPAAIPAISADWLFCALAEHDAAGATDALAALREDSVILGYADNVRFSRPFVQGVIARMSNDSAKARTAFTAARAEQETILQAQPDDPGALCVLGLIDAALGRKDDALREGRRAVELLPMEKDAKHGIAMHKYLAMIAAWVGDKELACEELALAVSRPNDLGYGQLKLFSYWDPLRGDPRFEKIVEEAKQPLAPNAPASSALSAPNLAPAPEKSIAVLPFENLSEEKANAFFADGMQDEILTDLSRIADLKVISRTSVMHYKTGLARNLREIGEQLGVAHVVEGSVQRIGNRVRVNAQLIDARNDAHLWAQTYDRDLADVFAIQSEIAKAIADQLQAKLSPSEKKAIDLPPTNDLVAFDLYTRAKDLIVTGSASGTAKADLLHAIELLNKASVRDPSFLDAYCQLAYAHGLLYSLGLDHSSTRLALSEGAVDAAARLRPDAGETHLARARNLYQGHRDYDGALAELELALQTLPSDARIYQLKGFIQRRQKGRYEEATRTLEHAIDLDPRNVLTLNQIAAFNYRRLGRYADAKSAWDRLLAIRPDDNDAQVGRAEVDFDWKADTRPLHQEIDSTRATNPAAVQSIADVWLLCALAERDAAAAKNALVAAGDKPIILSPENVLFPRPLVEGLIARMNQDDAAARSAFTIARAEQEKIVQAQPNYGPALCVLGLIDAGLGRKEEAIREGHRAIELLPVEKDLPEGMDMIKYLAMMAAWVGDKDLACEQLAIAISRPSGLTYGELKLLPLWDPLRGDPRFEQIVASLAPK